MACDSRQGDLSQVTCCKSPVARGGTAVRLMEASPKRYDLFIVLHDNVGYETKELAMSVERKVRWCGCGKIPGVLSTAAGVMSNRNVIFDAILKTRGGGVLLFFLNQELFLKWDRFVLGAILAALELEKSRNESEKVKVAFVWDDKDAPLTEEYPILAEIVRRFKMIDRTEIAAQNETKSGFEKRITDAITAQWESEAGPTALGESLDGSILNFVPLFMSEDVATLKSELGIGDNTITNVEEVFGAIVGGHAPNWTRKDWKDPKLLRDVLLRRMVGPQRMVPVDDYLNAFFRKWHSGDYLEWGELACETLKRKLLEADWHIALSTLKSAILHCRSIAAERQPRARELHDRLQRTETCLKGKGFLAKIFAKMSAERIQVGNMHALLSLRDDFETIGKGCACSGHDLDCCKLFVTTSLNRVAKVERTFVELGFPGPDSSDLLECQLREIHDKIRDVEGRVSCLEERPNRACRASGASQVATS